MHITILGCGSSGGVPLINGNWGACNPFEPRNRRYRSGILLRHKEQHILLDTSPDLREQLMKAKASSIDAVLYSHAHADHIYGLGELRPFSSTRQDPIPLYGDPQTLKEVEKAFAYAFTPSHQFYKPFVESHPIQGRFSLFGVEIIPIEQNHTVMTSWGYRVGNFAYSPDFKTISSQELEKLQGLELWIVNCLQWEEHPTHSHFKATLSLIQQLRPKRSILINMNHHLDYQTLLAQCPPGVEPAYDGMVIEL